MALPDGQILQLLTDEVCRRLLRQLVKAGAQTQQQLTSALGLNSSTISRRMALLEEAGLVVWEGPRKPYSIAYPSKTREFLIASASLAQVVAEGRVASARAYTDELREDDPLTGGELLDRMEENA